MVNPLDFIRIKKIDYKSAEEKYKNDISKLDPEVKAFYLGYTDNINVKEDYVKQGNSRLNSEALNNFSNMMIENALSYGDKDFSDKINNAIVMDSFNVTDKQFDEDTQKELNDYAEKLEQKLPEEIKKNINNKINQSVNYTNNSVNPNLNLTKEQQSELNEAISERYTKTDDPTPGAKESTANFSNFESPFSYYTDLTNDLKLKNDEDIKNQIEEWKNKAKKTNKGDVNYSQRVSLNVAPINKVKNVSNLLSETEWNYRLGYILGNASDVGIDDLNEGLLYELFGPTRGIVFPYTPDIDFQHKVEYEETNIPHSNINAQHYKNTPPPTISLTAEFTADNKDNARYMYGVIHFLRSISKCEFGEEVVKSRSNVAGVPPPTLFLNGWGNLINNVPVVVKSFGIKLGKDKHYVYIDNLDIWLPTDISITIQMGIQFNLDKYKMKFDLNKYKKGILGTDKDGDSNYAIYNTYDVVHSGNNYTFTDSSTIKTKIYSAQAVPNARRFNGSGWTW